MSRFRRYSSRNAATWDSSESAAIAPSWTKFGVPESMLMVIFALAGALWINLFNFMDGIDGLAASEAVFVLAGAALVAFLFEPGVAGDPRLWWMLGLAAACLGFLLLNWPPARIFMGDAGSTYLGLMTAFFALTTGASYWLSVWQWLILGALFLADSLATLARRIIGRDGRCVRLAQRRDQVRAYPQAAEVAARMAKPVPARKL